MKKLLIFSIFFIFTGCATSPSYDEHIQSVDSLPRDKMRIYFIREANMVGVFVDYPFAIDSVNKYAIPYGSFFYVDLEPGEYKVVTEARTTAGKFILSINGEVGKTYYIKVEEKDGSIRSYVLGGTIGGVIGEAAGPVGGRIGSTVGSVMAVEANGGPFQLKPLSEEDAIKMMQKLKFISKQSS